jgi:regulator of protease activity HflC (stomatin/prohibitin superfamily)
MMFLEFLPVVIITVVVLFFAEVVVRALGQIFGIYTINGERQARVYVLFGNVLGVIDEPGFHFLWPKLGPGALIVNTLGQCYVRDLRLDQQYLRSNPVNSEEGAPMGIGVWYEMYITDPVAHVFRNTDPRGSLAANVGTATVKCLSNMKLAEMLQSRHPMSHAVREEVSPLSTEWGYKLGSVYIRKVHFRDHGMIRQIEAKVVNRLRQVTSAIKQDGVNQVNIITSQAEKEAAVEFARAAVVRSEIVGRAISGLAAERDVADALFDILETQRLLAGRAELTLIPREGRSDLLTQIMASTPAESGGGAGAGGAGPSGSGFGSGSGSGSSGSGRRG